ncbi:MAG: chromosome segregation protein SMC [Coriobacteriia bacterium]|nr:chromosome segregation protein SMC [Coriobacteriia bacterium]
MYLKRLEIKGFKSFADKSVIALEPGISAIVGPNGSGKSNISDAILWVLGERNAKSLRGAVMEDVIFAGSSTRKPVSVAEASLVLDNTDGTLPLDFAEVEVTRRLYRSGESEYLINKSACRRLDVLDILHDSGLGTDTNSIISQGHLDSILQSKPEDRRALIEEAAGVLKHKQRKQRSERKLERMDQNLERIADVMAEIERQLKPLRIKAKRAAAYDGLCERLNDLTLQLAVDDLKIIKKKWDANNEQRDKIKEQVAEKKTALTTAEQSLAKLREEATGQGAQIMEHSNKQRRLASAIEKFDAFALLMDEKRRNAQATLDKLSTSSDGEASPEKQAILKEIENIESELTKLENDAKQVETKLEASKHELDEREENLNSLQQSYDQLTGSQRSYAQERDDLRQKINDAQDSIVEAQAKTATVETKIEDLTSQIKSAKIELEEANANLNNKSKEAEKLEAEANKITTDLESATAKANAEHEGVEEAQNRLSDTNASIMALEEILKSSYEETSSATKWLEANKAYVAGGIKNLSDEIDVPDKYISLVETLLGSYSTSFIAKDNTDVAKVEDALKQAENAEGSVRLVVGEGSQNKDVAACVKEFGAVSLYDEVKLADKNKSLGALANVVVFETSFEAFKAMKKYKNLICASLDGSIIYPDGRTLIGSAFYVDSAFDKDSSRTILSYKKNLKKLTRERTKLERDLSKSKDKLDKLNANIEQLKNTDYEAKHKLAMARADVDIANNIKSNSENSLKQKQEQLEAAKDEQNKLKDAYSSTAPEIEKSRTRLKELDELSKKEAEDLSSIEENLNKSRELTNDSKNKHSQLMVESTSLNERLNSQKHNLENANTRKTEIDNRELANKQDFQDSKLTLKITEELNATFSKLSDLAKRDLSVIDKAAGNISQEAKRIQEQTDEAMNKATEARKSLDTENENLNNMNIELAKLEVQVQNAVDAIDQIEGVTVDEALEMPDIEDRAGKEERAFKLRRRIANMGTINPDAKRDYDELKERYDFLAEQVDDLRSARKSLRDITRIIDSRMKDDFATTFDIVNTNFGEIFSVLFPGGKARLELVDKDDIENTGVEVKAQPRGKHISKMSLLSGGEKSLTALCLLFAVYKTRSTPFYILDEVEAALDDTNLRRLIKYLEELRHKTQLIMITHQRRTMEMADILYGVSMKSDGVSKVISQKLEKK